MRSTSPVAIASAHVTATAVCSLPPERLTTTDPEMTAMVARGPTINCGDDPRTA